jgi:hypothetical protein
MAALFAGGYLPGGALSTGVLAGLFAGGVAAHAIGHYGFEGEPPAVLSRPVAVLEAPAWLFSAWFFPFPLAGPSEPSERPVPLQRVGGP